MSEIRRNRQYTRTFAEMLLAASIVLFAACSSAPPVPTASLAEARQAIELAERQDASRYAAAELDEAREKLAAADKAVAAEKMINAGRLAQEATVMAELAAARTDASKAAEVNAEMSRSTRALAEEIQRSGDKQ